ncbi:hypothetical protein HMPREF9062_0661, partial [Actinomyces sp. oral taxon 448 str. F0400]
LIHPMPRTHRIILVIPQQILLQRRLHPLQIPRQINHNPTLTTTTTHHRPCPDAHAVLSPFVGRSRP